MYIYRPHKGSLAEAMKEARVFADEKEMFRHIVNYWTIDGTKMFTEDDLSLSGVIGDDERVHWKECRYVLTRRCGGEMYPIPQCIGTCSEVRAQ